MKIKSDFVTNSSSTSFIIADIREDKSKPIEIEIQIGKKLIKYNLMDMLSSYEISENELKEMIEDHKEELKNYKNFKIHYLSADDCSSNPLELFFCNNGIEQSYFNDDKIIVLQGEGRY